MQQTIWTDIKANQFVLLIPPTQNEHIYMIWSVETDAKRTTGWLHRNIHTQNNQWHKNTHAPNTENRHK